MTKSQYIWSLTLIHIALLIPLTINTYYHQQVLILPELLKTALSIASIALILIVQITFYSNKRTQIISITTSLFIFIGYSLSIMHWPFSKTVLYPSLILLAIQYLTLIIWEKEKNILFYMSYLTVANQIIFKLFINHQSHWIINFILIALISLIGIFTISIQLKNRKRIT